MPPLQELRNPSRSPLKTARLGASPFQDTGRIFYFFDADMERKLYDELKRWFSEGRFPEIPMAQARRFFELMEAGNIGEYDREAFEIFVQARFPAALDIRKASDDGLIEMRRESHDIEDHWEKDTIEKWVDIERKRRDVRERFARRFIETLARVNHEEFDWLISVHAPGSGYSNIEGSWTADILRLSEQSLNKLLDQDIFPAAKFDRWVKQKGFPDLKRAIEEVDRQELMMNQDQKLQEDWVEKSTHEKHFYSAAMDSSTTDAIFGDSDSAFSAALEAFKSLLVNNRRAKSEELRKKMVYDPQGIQRTAIEQNPIPHRLHLYEWFAAQICEAFLDSFDRIFHVHCGYLSEASKRTIDSAFSDEYDRVLQVAEGGARGIAASKNMPEQQISVIVQRARGMCWQVRAKYEGLLQEKILTHNLGVRETPTVDRNDPKAVRSNKATKEYNGTVTELADKAFQAYQRKKKQYRNLKAACKEYAQRYTIKGKSVNLNSLYTIASEIQSGVRGVKNKQK